MPALHPVKQGTFKDLVRRWPSYVAKLWAFRDPIVASLFLLSPVLVYDVALSVQNGRGVDKLSLFAIPASILWLIAAHSLFRRVWIATLLLFPFYVITAIELFLITKYDTRLTSSAISVMLENAHHGIDFGRAQTPVLAISFVSLLASFAVFGYGTRRLEVQTWRPFQLAISGLLLVYISVAVHRIVVLGDLGTGIMDVVAHDRNSPFGVVPQSYIAYRVFEDAIEHQRRASSFSFGAVRSREFRKPEIYVLVIGESSRRDHWSLFGYQKPTTPNLSKIPGLVPLQNMVTQAALTQISVPLILTRRSVDSPEEGLNEKSIISAFKEAGFVTFWLSTQQRDQWTGAINRYTGEADHVRFFERRHDGVLVDAMKSALQDHRQGQNLFFVLHTQGSHFVFRDRYPADIAPFSNSESSGNKLVAEYDNSIAYTDRVLSALIELLKEWQGSSGLFYVADHGENLYDDDRNLFGHMLNNEYDMPIPAFLWLSDSYAEQAPEKLAAAHRNAVKPLNTRVVFSTLACLAGIKIPGMDLSKLSLVNDGMEVVPRMFLKHGQFMDFDKWMLSRSKQRDAEHPSPWVFP